MTDYEFNNLDMEVQGAFPNQQRSPENVIGWVMQYLREKDRLK